MLKFTTFNTQGCTEPKAEAIRELLQQTDLLCLTETWSPQLPVSLRQFVVQDAAPYTSKHRRRHGGGFALLCNDPTEFKS